LVHVDGVGAVVLAVHVLIEAAELLPFDDSQGRIQHVQVSNLDVGRVVVVLVLIERNELFEVIPIAWRALDRPENRLVMT
jgi:hypothetical protein